LVAVSFHSFSVAYALEIRKKIKRAKLICGGHHSSSLPKQMISIGYDQVVIGEGENAIIDIGSNIFAYGQTYVALSRVKSLEGLYLTHFDYTKILCNPLVKAFYGDI
jgi:radical SAM superfamily enzyme YgiQ (UPF0313 family)